MKIKILSGLICYLGILSANAQTITAPVGQALTITNAVDVTGGGLNILTDTEFKIGGQKVLSNKGTNNVFLGGNSGNINTGNNNAFIGFNSGTVNTSGSFNLFLGSYAGASNGIGAANTFIGLSSGEQNTSGSNNMFMGTASGASNLIGGSNVFIGVNAGRFSNSNSNSFLGTACGYNTTTGDNNSGFGQGSGYLNTTGSNNVYMGVNAGYNSVTGSNNTFVGGGANTASGALTNVTAIGSGAIVSASNTVVLGNAATTITGIGLPLPAGGVGVSGLKFANLTLANNASPGPTGTNGKVLSVDNSGNVILVQITTPTGGTATTTSVGGPVSESWKESDGYLYNNSTNGVVIKGTGLDGNSLIVKGGVLSKEVNVKVEGSESWPDYVFKPNYKRMTLGEVEKFISINGHLPNIPSATEMAVTGNNLGKTDVKLLEKVEELTLYLLEMKKANDAQVAELKALKQQVNKLRKK